MWVLQILNLAHAPQAENCELRHEITLLRALISELLHSDVQHAESGDDAGPLPTNYRRQMQGRMGRFRAETLEPFPSLADCGSSSSMFMSIDESVPLEDSESEEATKEAGGRPFTPVLAGLRQSSYILR